MADTGWMYCTDRYADVNNWSGTIPVADIQSVNSAYWLAVNVQTPTISSVLTYYYDISSIPVGATVDGIEVYTKLYNQNASYSRTQYTWVALTGNMGVYPANTWYEKSDEQLLSAGNTAWEKTWGGSSDNWGHEWTLEEFGDAEFTLRFRVSDSRSDSAPGADCILLKIYYTEAGGPDYRGRSTRRDGRFTRRTKN